MRIITNVTGHLSTVHYIRSWKSNSALEKTMMTSVYSCSK